MANVVLLLNKWDVVKLACSPVRVFGVGHKNGCYIDAENIIVFCREVSRVRPYPDPCRFMLCNC